MQVFKNDIENKEEIKAGALSLITQHAIDINAKKEISLAIIKNINLCVMCVLTVYFLTNPSLLFDNGTKTGILRILLLLFVDFIISCIMRANINIATENSKADMCINIIEYCNLKSLLSADELEDFKYRVSHIALDKSDND